MGKFDLSSSLLNKFADAVCNEIGSMVLDGVHYISLKDSNDNKIAIERLKNLRMELDANKKKPTEFLEIIKVSNGYVFILDKELTYYLFKLLIKASNTTEFDNLVKTIPEKPDKIIENSKLQLAKLCNFIFNKKKKDTVDVCLYNANDVDKFNVSAITKDGERVLVQYNAFRLTQTDLDDINKLYLIKKNMRISGSQICEILEDCVLVRLTLDSAG
jgi:hypothetical protein